jgi:phosphatidylglycerophosphatase A
MKRDLATLHEIGYAPAPGTFASFVAAVLAAWLLRLPYGWALVAIGAAFSLLIGTKASSRHMREGGTAHDPSEIVIDELHGQFLTFTVWHLWMVALAGIDQALVLLNTVAGEPLYLGIGFLLFRFYDILKPWPISLADRRLKGGFGVMFDDTLAAIAAGTTLYAIYLFWPLVSGHLNEMAV